MILARELLRRVQRCAGPRLTEPLRPLAPTWRWASVVEALQHVKLIGADEPVNNAVWRVHDLADQRVLEFRNRSTRLRE